MGKNVIIFGADMRSNVNIDNKNKDVSILGQAPIQGLDQTILKAAATYPVNFTQPKKNSIIPIMQAAASYLLMLQKYINSKQKTHK